MIDMLLGHLSVRKVNMRSDQVEQDRVGCSKDAILTFILTVFNLVLHVISVDRFIFSLITYTQKAKTEYLEKTGYQD